MAGFVDDEQTERQYLVREMLRSDGWSIAREMLQRRLNGMARRLVTNPHAELEQVRQVQAEYRLLEKLLDFDTALGFLTTDGD